MHDKDADEGDGAGGWDHSSHDRFFEYYSRQSESAQTLTRYASIQDILLGIIRDLGRGAGSLEVADIGCGAGTQAIMWAREGHRVHGLDVNERLIEVGRERARRLGHQVDLHVGTAVALPWDDASMDVCLVPELLEHVAEWEDCLNEFARILRPDGALFLSTTNKLCPLQLEFNLPLYSWYPGPLKRRFEKLALTTRPELANFATYPAVNWFTFYSLRAALRPLGFRSMDRFDIMNLKDKSATASLIVRAIRTLPPLRWLAHVATPSTTVVAIRESGSLP